jgi:hypothetical protein
MKMEKKYFQVEGRDEEIKVSLDYELGGYSFMSGESSKRGYYAYVQPVERGDGFESFAVFDGFKVLLNPVNRQSKKQEAIAREKFNVQAEQFAKRIARKKGWVLTIEEEQRQEKLTKVWGEF